MYMWEQSNNITFIERKAKTMKTKIYLQRTAQQVIASLPPVCYTVTLLCNDEAADQNGLYEDVETLVRIDTGTSGFSPCDTPCDNPQEAADYLNKSLGVTDKQVEAMKKGSMFGWDCPAADPNNPINL